MWKNSFTTPLKFCNILPITLKKKKTEKGKRKQKKKGNTSFKYSHRRSKAKQMRNVHQVSFWKSGIFLG